MVSVTPSIQDSIHGRVFRNRELVVQCRLDTETYIERKTRLRKQRLQESQRKLEEYTAQWDPKNDPNVTQDEYKTLFVAQLAPGMTEKKLSKELSEYGPIRRVRIVKDKKDRSRGYAFVEYEHKADLKVAYKMADGRKIDGKRILVDVERGRTVPGWKPRRLGGGMGNAAKAQSSLDRKREEERSSRRSRDERTENESRDRERRTRESERERDRDGRRERDRGDRGMANGGVESRDRNRYGDRRLDDRRRSRSRERDYGRDRGGSSMDYGAGMGSYGGSGMRDYRSGMSGDRRGYGGGGGGGDYDRGDRDRGDRDRKRTREQGESEYYKDSKRSRRSRSMEQPEEGEVVEPNSRRDRRRERDYL
eukprot:TRINITY_DN16076_c0_g1_i1.p2 TRINITY_DN16076_c0_g1~~TRINITY_DN16076_c0_g1_i1.p2  ORF type:complete len:364 (-),score=58.57 TRINITY_DN16076_c0_g1_i1:113-1204(-)